MSSPLVSVIIPAFNVEKYIGDCLESMISQTYNNLEILIIDDACTDNTMAVVAGFKDTRIHIIKNETNLGLAASVNKAIAKARGVYIARMDGDDLSHAERIARQVAFLEQHPEISIVGTAMKSFGYSNYVHRFPASHAACKTQLLFNVCFGHPSVLIRKSVFDNSANLYNAELRQYSEEYELWCRLVDNYQFANLEEELVLYRTFPASEKNEAEEKRRRNSFLIRKNFIALQWGEQSEEDYHYHDHICTLKLAKSLAELQQWTNWLRKCITLNEASRSFDPVALKKELSKRCFELRYWNRHLGIGNMWQWYTGKDHLAGYSPSISQHIKFLLRSLLKA